MPNFSQTAIAALKRPSRTSARLKKEVETIAIDDDDEIGEEKELCSAGNGEASESAGVSGEPAEKRPRTDEPIKDEVLLVFLQEKVGQLRFTLRIYECLHMVKC